MKNTQLANLKCSRYDIILKNHHHFNNSHNYNKINNKITNKIINIVNN